MTCGSCTAGNREDRRFCGACGATLGVPCPRCAFRNDTRDRFCGGCGTATARTDRVVPIAEAAETAAAVLLSALEPQAKPVDMSRPPPTHSTVSPLGGGLPALSPTDIARLLSPRGDDAGSCPPPQLTQADLDRLFGVT